MCISERKLSFATGEESFSTSGGEEGGRNSTIEVLNTTLAGSGRRNEFEYS